MSVAGSPSSPALFSLDLELADFGLRLMTLDTSLWQTWTGRFAEFRSPAPRRADLVLEVHRSAETCFLPLRGGELQIEWTLDGHRLRFASHYEQASIDLPSGRGAAELAAEGDVENLLRVFLALRCLDEGGLIMHASSAVRDGRSYVFFGPSGAGKTTMARLSAQLGYPVHGDDIVAIRPRDGVYCAYSLPFGATQGLGIRRNLCAPIAGLYRLRKGPAHQVRDLPRVQALTELISAVPFVHVHSQLTQRALSACEALMGQVPVRELWFRPDASVWSAL